MSSSQVFRDRRHAGRLLAKALRAYAGRSDVTVLGLPRGGLPVAYEVAHALHAPLDVLVVRKLGVPGHEEYAMGAIASGGAKVFDDPLVKALAIPKAAIEAVVRAEQAELERRERLYRDGRPLPDLRGRCVIVVDDGLATGSTMRAAVKALRSQAPERIVVGVPTGSVESCEYLRSVADEVVCARTPQPFRSVGQWYEDFSQTSDDEVHDLLVRARNEIGEVGQAAPAK
jgi:predicted phosphoribosyltransferase